jgi:transposase
VIEGAARYICGNEVHPDHSTLYRFRNESREGFKKIFTKILVIAWETRHLKKTGNISVDETKLHANAGKHSAVSVTSGRQR